METPPTGWHRCGRCGLALLASISLLHLLDTSEVVEFEDVVERVGKGSKKLGEGLQGISDKVVGGGLQPRRRRSVKSLPSRRWLEGRRLGNNDHLLTKTDVEKLIAEGALGPIGPIATSLVCNEESPLATSPDLNYDVASVDEWTRIDASQVMLRAFHENQYGPAREEARARLEEWDAWEGSLYRQGGDDIVLPDDGSGNGTETKPIERVGLFDFECPDAKFLVFQGWSGPFGLGASLRHMGVTGDMFAGIAYERIALFMGDVPFASCERGDIQCSFMPSSPCVLTQDEVDSAPRIHKKDLGAYLTNHPDLRVVVAARFRGNGGSAEDGIQKSMDKLYAAQGNRTEEERASFSNKIAELMKKSFGPLPIWNIEVAAQLFLVRPNGAMRETHSQIFEETFPQGYNSSKAIHMAIRGSDKCASESQCLEFRQYMQKVNDFIQKETDQTYEYILVTSEDIKVLEAQQKYAKEDNSSGLTYLVNKREVAQGTGNYLAVSKNITRDDVMTMTMATWKLSLYAGYNFMNGCSHFSKMMGGTHMFGCSVAKGVSGWGVRCGKQMGGGMGRY